MKQFRLTIMTVVACLTVFLTACKKEETPSQVATKFFNEITTNECKELEKFATTETAAILKMTYKINPEPMKKSFLEIKVVGEEIKGDRAIVKFLTKGDNEEAEMHLTKIDKQWKVDLSELLAGQAAEQQNKNHTKQLTITCINILKQFGTSFAMYSDTPQAKGKYPDKLLTLKETGLLTDDKMYICPLTNKNYIYLGKDLPERAPMDIPVMISPIQNKQVVVLYVAGHVQVVNIPQPVNNNVEIVKYILKSKNISESSPEAQIVLNNAK